MSTSAPTTFKVGLTADEKRLYSQLFKSLDPEGTGIITGDKARSTFEKSGLPPAILGEIWQLADGNNLGFLTQFGFCYAMRLIGYTQSGQPPNASLADNPGPLPKFAGFIAPPPPLQSQSTNGSFMQSQPSAIIPQNTTTFQSQPQDPIPPISGTDFTRFRELFIKTTGSPTSELDGSQARNIFLKAKLPTDTLGQIWNLVDIDNLGKLNMASFVVAMHLIQGLLSGNIKQLPPFLPDSIWQSVQSQTSTPHSNNPIVNNASGSRQASYASVNSQQTVRHMPTTNQLSTQPPHYGSTHDDWVITPTLKQQYDSIFNNLDKSKSGQLNPDQVAQFLMTSKLGQADLATVWDLSDIQNTGIFTKVEFSIALFLINKKLSGGQLPNIVPESLLKSVSDLERNQSQGPLPTQHTSVATQPQAPPQVASQGVPPILEQPAAPKNQAPKSSIEDLADIFGSPASTPQNQVPPTKPSLQTRTSSSDLTPSDNLPKVRKGLGGFKPTSTFGQSLIAKEASSPSATSGGPSAISGANNAADHHDLLGDDVHGPSSIPAPSALPNESSETQDSEANKNINYDALRAVPPPPRKATGPSLESSPAEPYPSSPQQPPSQQSIQPPSFGGHSSAGHTPPVHGSPMKSPPVSRNISSPLNPQQSGQQQSYFPPQPSNTNNDLLADPAISGQLSQATSDIANISNQVKSLSTQTGDLHEKKTRAEQELSKILSSKKEIEAKLRILKSSYDNEVKQFQEVETNLSKAKEETEALRSESSIAEAKFNSLSTDLNEKQLQMENFQKENGSVKEKLGIINAEIAELHKNVESVVAENQRLSNQLSVQKSQVQVSLVKKQELESKLNEVLASNKNLQDEINRNHEAQQKAELEHEALSKQIDGAKNFKPVEPKVSKSAIGAAVAGAAALVGGAAAVTALHAGKESTNDKTITEASESKSIEEGIPEVKNPNVEKQEFDEPDTEESTVAKPSIEESKGSVPIEKEVAPPVQETSSQFIDQVPGAFPIDTNEPTTKGISAPEVKSTPVPVEALVDGVKEKPSADMTGIEDAENVEKAPKFPQTPKKEEPNNDTMTNTNSSVTTGSGETPITSPSNSDFQFPHGGLVGMPGVLVGVQRTDSLTSSVQNNAALSVRDDNIEEISDRETIDNEALNDEVLNTEEVAAAPGQNKNRSETTESDGDKHSSGVESFEMVNVDDAKDSDDYPESKSNTFILKNAGTEEAELQRSKVSPDEEFPPIKELDYDESDSSDDDDFHEAKADLSESTQSPAGTQPIQSISKSDDFDSAFDDLEPAAPEPSSEPPSYRSTAAPIAAVSEPYAAPAVQSDLFADEFNNLETAKEAEVDEDFRNEPSEDFFNNDFTNSNMPDFSQQPQEEGKAGNDEWEQLFAGFGNSASNQNTPAANQPPVFAGANQHPNQHLIDELVGMGFDEKTANDALEKEGWNLEAATNYLLDNA